MSPDRFQEITGRYPELRIGVVGDFCLDRYLEIDPARREISIETGLPVHNVVRVRSQPGAAGTILNNLAALGVGVIQPVGFAGEDGEGHELRAALCRRPGVNLDHFQSTDRRRTFTYCKPLVMEPGKPPVELNRLDSKNWTPTPPDLQACLVDATRSVAADADALVLMDQVDLPETGVVSARLLDGVAAMVRERPVLPILADSRRGLRGYPPVSFKMNRAELHALASCPEGAGLEELKRVAAALARKQNRPVFVTLSEEGILGASPGGAVDHVSARPVRGPIDIVGAGDAVTANLAAALAAGAAVREALEIAMAAASLVIHQLGTTGTASVDEIRSLLFHAPTT